MLNFTMIKIEDLLINAGFYPIEPDPETICYGDMLYMSDGKELFSIQSTPLFHNKEEVSK